MKKNKLEKHPISFKDLLDTLDVPGESNTFGPGFEVVVSYLESEDESFEIAPYMKAAGNVVLGIGVVPSLSKGENVFKVAMCNASRFQRNVDGCLLLNEDTILDNIERNHLTIDVDGWIDEEVVKPIQNGIAEILTPGIPNIASDTLREVLQDCGTFMLTRGKGEGTLRIEDAWINAFNSALSIIANFEEKTARKLIIKLLIAKDDTVLNHEMLNLKGIVTGLLHCTDVIIGAGYSDSLTYGQIEIVMLASGFDPAL